MHLVAKNRVISHLSSTANGIVRPPARRLVALSGTMGIANLGIAMDITPPNTVAEAAEVFDEVLVPNLEAQLPGPFDVGILRRHRLTNIAAGPIRVDTRPAIVHHPGVVMTAEEQEERVTISLRTVYNPNLSGLLPDASLHLMVGEVVDDYRIDAVLASGHFSVTYRATSIRHEKVVCIKVLNERGIDDGMSEVLTHAKIIRGDPNNERPLVRMLDFFYYKEHVMIVTVLLNASLVAHYAHREAQGTRGQYYTAETAGTLAAQLLSALAYLHSLGIVHCDVQPSNVCVVDENARTFKLIDFGSAVFRSDQCCSYVQARFYRAPEVLLKRSYDRKIDVWGTASTIIEPVIGHVLFQFGSSVRMLAAHQAILGPFPAWMLEDVNSLTTGTGSFYEVDSAGEGIYILTSEVGVSLREIVSAHVERAVFGDVDGFVDFLTSLFAIDPTVRPDGVAAKQHPWLAGYGL